MSEIQNTEQGANTPAQNTKKFLDYVGLQKFWELIKAKLGAKLSVNIDTNGASIELKDVSDTKISDINIPIASDDVDNKTAGLMTPEHIESLKSKIGGIGFGTNFKPATSKNIEINKTENGESITYVYDNYLNLDFIVEDNQLKIVDLNSKETIQENTGEKDAEGNDIIKEKEINTVLSSINLSDIFKQGFIKESDITQDPNTGDIFLNLTFEYVDGNEKTEQINLNDLIHQYSAGNGLDLTYSGEGFNDDKYSGTFNIKIKNIEASGEPGTENYDPGYQEKYLRVDNNGLYTTGIENEIEDKINEKLANYTSGKTTSSIYIEGGPLANEISDTEKNNWPADWKDETGRIIIPENKTLQEVLTTLFTNIISATISKDSGYPKNSVSLKSPNLTVKHHNTSTSITNSSTVEYGTKVDINASIVNNDLATNTRTVKFTSSPGNSKHNIWEMVPATFIDGTNTPDETNDKVVFNQLDNYSVTVNSDKNKTKDGLASIKLKAVTISNKAQDTGFGTNNTTYNYNGYQLTNSSNTITVTQGSDSLSINPGTLPNKIYYASNSIGERLPNNYVYINDDPIPANTTSLSSSSSITINCKQKIWYGYIIDKDKVINFNNIEYPITDGKVTIDGIEYTVETNKLIYNETEYPITDGKVTINNIIYTVETNKLIYDKNSVNYTNGELIRDLASNTSTIKNTWYSSSSSNPTGIEFETGTKQILLVLKNVNDIKDIVDRRGNTVRSTFKLVNVKVPGANNYKSDNDSYTVWYCTPDNQDNGLTAEKYTITYN